MLSKMVYSSLILIWSTTPLLIKTTAESFGAIGGLFWRVLLSLVIGFCLVAVFDGKTLAIRRNFRLYLVAALGICPNMLLVYWAASLIPASLVALIFGMSPFFTMVLTKPILGTGAFSYRQVMAAMVAALGLVVILYSPVLASSSLLLGVGLVLLSNVCHTTSSLLVKRLGDGYEAEPLQLCLGSLLLAMPGIALAFFTLQPEWLVIEQISLHDIAALIALVLFGSLFGFAAYYWILREMSVNSVAVIPLITPALALMFDMLLRGTRPDVQLLVGAGLILSGLAVYQNIGSLLLSKSKVTA